MPNSCKCKLEFPAYESVTESRSHFFYSFFLSFFTLSALSLGNFLSGFPCPYETNAKIYEVGACEANIITTFSLAINHCSNGLIMPG
jgi:hypothetical protein